MRLSNVARGDRLSSRLLYALCALFLGSGHLMRYEPCATGRISSDGRIQRTRTLSCGGLPNGQWASASCSPHSCRG